MAIEQRRTNKQNITWKLLRDVLFSRFSPWCWSDDGCFDLARHLPERNKDGGQQPCTKMQSGPKRRYEAVNII